MSICLKFVDEIFDVVVVCGQGFYELGDCGWLLLIWEVGGSGGWVVPFWFACFCWGDMNGFLWGVGIW